MLDHETLEQFVHALANATVYKSHPLGFEDSLSLYWQEQAREWVNSFTETEEQAKTTYYPRSERVKIWRNQWGKWSAYIGKRRVVAFGLDEKAAREWLESFPEEQRV